MKAAQSVARKMSETQREQRARGMNECLIATQLYTYYKLGRGAQARVKVPSDQACVFFSPLL